MNYYNKKCLGCGNYFSKDINSISYVVNPKATTKYCKRCFQLIHYGKLDNSKVDNKKIEDILNEINPFNNYVIYVVDLLDLGSLKRINRFTKIDLIVINKFSLFPKKFNLTLTLSKLQIILKDLGFADTPFIVYDAIEKFNISTIYKTIKDQSLNNKKIYIIGNTNAGKSSLINALLKHVKKEAILSVSAYPNTTLNLLKIKLDKFTTIIDTPGLIDNQNYITNLDKFSLNKLSSYKTYVAKTFELKDNTLQSFFVESFFYLKINKIDDIQKASITFYSLKGIKIHRTKFEKIESIKQNKKEVFNLFLLNDNDTYKSKIIDLDKNHKYNLFVNGICLISLKNIKEIEIFYLNDIIPFLTDKALI